MFTTIAQVTDLHLDDHMAKNAGIDSRQNAFRILEAIAEKGIENIVLTGDMGAPHSLGWLLGVIRERKLKPFFVLGNHDELQDFENIPAVSDFVKPDGLYYTVTIAGVTCIFLDSSRDEIHKKQCRWLEDELGAATETVAVFSHFPAIDCGNTTVDRVHPLRNRENLQNIFVVSGKNISIFCGHYHTTHEQKKDNIFQYVTPSTLFQIKQQSDKIERENDSFGYRLIRLSSTKVDTDVIIYGQQKSNKVSNKTYYNGRL